jgi:hypothetical protein
MLDMPAKRKNRNLIPNAAGAWPAPRPQSEKVETFDTQRRESAKKTDTDTQRHRLPWLDNRRLVMSLTPSDHKTGYTYAVDWFYK